MVTETVVYRPKIVPLSPNFSCTIYSDAIRKWGAKV